MNETRSLAPDEGKEFFALRSPFSTAGLDVIWVVIWVADHLFGSFIMPQDKQHKKKSKKKRQPSFTLPKNPYNYKYGSVRSLSKNKAPLVGTWTRLRTPGKLGQRDQNIKDRCKNGFLKLNEKVSQNLDVHEISSWMQKQKVFVDDYYRQMNFTADSSFRS